MKTCFKCGESKPLTEFYRHKNMADGHLGKCRECTKAYARANRATRADWYRNYDKRRFKNDPRVRARHRRYLQTEAGKKTQRRAQLKYIAENPDRRAANTLLGNAARDGRISKPDVCSKCGCGGIIHGHHPDYTLPLEVVWLCPTCHKAVHMEHQA